MAITTSDDTLCTRPPQLASKKRQEGRGGVVVKFKDTVQVRATSHCKSDQQIIEEKHAKWYSQHELLKMRKRHIQIILALDNMSETDRQILKNVYGVDSVESRNVRHDRIRRVRLAILQEQEKQWDLQMTDEVQLANKVQMASTIAAKEAQLRGIQVMHEVVRDHIQQVQSKITPTAYKKAIGTLEVRKANTKLLDSTEARCCSSPRRHRPPS